MSETFERQVLRIWYSAEAQDYDEKVDPLKFARALAAEWFREPVAYAPEWKFDGVFAGAPLYRKPEGL